VTQAAPIITNRWLGDDDAASQSDTLNGTICAVVYRNALLLAPPETDFRCLMSGVIS